MGKKVVIQATICERCGATKSHQPKWCYFCGGEFKSIRTTLYTYVETYFMEIEKAFENKDYHYYWNVLEKK